MNESDGVPPELRREAAQHVPGQAIRVPLPPSSEPWPMPSSGGTSFAPTTYRPGPPIETPAPPAYTPAPPSYAPAPPAYPPAPPSYAPTPPAYAPAHAPAPPGHAPAPPMPAPPGYAPPGRPRHAADDNDKVSTLVMPAAGSRAARRTRRLRAWMLAIPVDFAALVSPLAWTLDHWRGTLAFAVISVMIFAAGGLYRGRRHISILDEIPSLLGRLLAAAAVVAVIFAQRHDSETAYLIEFMRSVAISAGLVLVGRAITRWAVLFARRHRWVEHGAIIVGGGPVAAELGRLLRRYPQYGLRFAGFIDDERARHATRDLMPWIGQVEDLDQMILATEADVIIIADAPSVTEERLVGLVRGPAAMRCDLLVVPRLHDFSTQVGSPDHIGAIPVMRIRRPTFAGPKWWLKRTFDILFASIALLLVSPVMLLCAVAVRLEGGRGVMFRQERLGLNGTRFNLIKFRSMRPASEEESRTNWSVANDRRVGPVGRFLRRTSLDELPQLWNVLRGDMTIVGPRPERPYFAEKFAAEHPLYGNRSRMPAGMTGLAQVSGLRGDTPIADRARFDNYYVENWSLWLDTKVLLRTFAEVFRAGGR